MATDREQMKKRVSNEQNGYAEAASAATLDGLRAAFALQNETIAAGARLFDAGVDATKSVGEAWTKAIRGGQDAATKLTVAGLKAAESAVERD